MTYSPFYSSPFYRKYPKYNYYTNNPYYYTKGYDNEIPNTSNSIAKENISSQEKVADEKTSITKEEREFFEILGIKLYFDDILLICLIFFLYKEEVKDEGLFIALILLLLS